MQRDRLEAWLGRSSSQRHRLARPDPKFWWRAPAHDHLLRRLRYRGVPSGAADRCRPRAGLGRDLFCVLRRPSVAEYCVVNRPLGRS
jgi:hypothetical protein